MIQILICTYDSGVRNVPNILLPPAEGIAYVVSMQYSEPCYLDQVPEVIKKREDVVFSAIAGRGLSANRNNAIAIATADLCVLADDDVRYSLNDLQRIEAEHAAHPEADVLLFQAKGPAANLLKDYPLHSFNYHNCPKGYSPMSIEITFKRERVKGIPFDLRFGIGSDLFVCGEEEVWLNTLHRKFGKTILYIPFPIVQTVTLPQGGCGFATNPKVQRAKGAVLYYIYGLSAWLRCLKESVVVAHRVKEARLTTLLTNTARGIISIMKTGR